MKIHSILPLKGNSACREKWHVTPVFHRGDLIQACDLVETCLKLWDSPRSSNVSYYSTTTTYYSQREKWLLTIWFWHLMPQLEESDIQINYLSIISTDSNKDCEHDIQNILNLVMSFQIAWFNQDRSTVKKM